MNGLYVLAAILALDSTNKINNHILIKVRSTLFWTFVIFLNIGIEHIIAAMNIISSNLSA